MTDKRHVIYLHGSLGDKYTLDPIILYAKNIKDIINGLSCGLGKKFKAEIRSGSWHVVLGKPKGTEDIPITEDSLLTETSRLFPIKEEEVHIYPRLSGNIATIAGVIGALGAGVAGTVTASGAVIGGVGLAGTVSTLGVTVGSALGITTGLATTLLNVGIAIAATSALSAITQAISNPQMDYDKAEVDRAASFLFNGVVNVVEQGGAVQLIYGKHLAGSTVISVNMVSEELGSIANILPPEDRNFLLPLSSNWVGHDASLSTEVVNGEGRLVITKDLITHGDGALLVTLEPSQRYRLSVKYLSTFKETFTTFQGSSTLWNRFHSIHLQYRSNNIEEEYAKFSPVYGALIALQGDKEFSAYMEFTSVATPINAQILLYRDPDRPIGTELKITFIKIEKL